MIAGMTEISLKPCGFFNIYKPKGQASFAVTRHITKLLNEIRGGKKAPGPSARQEPRPPVKTRKGKHKNRKFKVGHAGTLDPIAEGVLLVCFGSATRLIPYVHRQEKIYRATFLLGYESETDDTEKELIPTGFSGTVTREDVLESLNQFRGEIEQVPPAYSAVKVEGRQAYRLARLGEEVQLAAKSVTVHELTLERFEYPELDLQIRCSSGTYIRSIGRDLGKSLGCGAVMSGLKRTAVGEFTAEEAVPFLELNALNLHDYFRPSIQLINRMPTNVCTSEEIELLRNGQAIDADKEMEHAADEEIAAIDTERNLIAILRFENSEQLLLPQQVFVDEVS